MDVQLSKIKDLKAQRSKIDEEIKKLTLEVTTELAAVTRSGKPRKKKGAVQNVLPLEVKK